MKKDKTFLDIAREYFPDRSDDELIATLWDFTGFPSGFHGDTETELRKQLKHHKDNPNWCPLDDYT
jgi:hypothetical protein